MQGRLIWITSFLRRSPATHIADGGADWAMIKNLPEISEAVYEGVESASSDTEAMKQRKKASCVGDSLFFLILLITKHCHVSNYLLVSSIVLFPALHSFSHLEGIFEWMLSACRFFRGPRSHVAICVLINWTLQRQRALWQWWMVGGCTIIHFSGTEFYDPSFCIGLTL